MENRNYVVVGDLILDRFLYGDALRISPEAPALVLDVREEKNTAGGAFNVFSHIHNLGHAAKLVTISGRDIGRYLEDFQELSRFKDDLVLLPDHSRVTSIKTRLISYYKLSYLGRFDQEATAAIDGRLAETIIARASEHLNGNSSLLIIDYNKGVVTRELSRRLIALCKSRQIPVYVDTKRDDISQFEGAHLIKPNKIEFQRIKVREQLSECDDTEACRILMDKYSLQNFVITLGKSGMLAVPKDGAEIAVQAHDVNIKELSGAGDSVLAVLATLIGEGHSLSEALEAANNIAASFVSTGVMYRARREDLFSREPVSSPGDAGAGREPELAAHY